MRYNKQQVTVYEYPCSSSSECHSINATLEKGLYSFEVWGASGGSNSDETSAPGGYSYGEINIPKRTEIFIFLGGKGVISTEASFTDSVFNGGGKGSKNTRHQFAGSGGGASDIRINDYTFNHRVIVAGGGGGSSFDFNISKGGSGGGETGEQGSQGCNINLNTECGEGGQGGEQTGDLERSGLGEDHEGGRFNAAGGGGGWFGGKQGEMCGAGGGGGSGFVYKEENELVNVPIEYRLRNAFTRSGDTSFPSPINESIIKGRYGHGIARITSLVPSCTQMLNLLNLSFILRLSFLCLFLS